MQAVQIQRLGDQNTLNPVLNIIITTEIYSGILGN